MKPINLLFFLNSKIFSDWLKLFALFVKLMAIEVKFKIVLLRKNKRLKKKLRHEMKIKTHGAYILAIRSHKTCF